MRNAMSTNLGPNKAVEYKYTDTEGSLTSIPNNGIAVNLMASITRGTGYLNNYLGARIKPTGLSVRLCMRPGDPSNIVRMILLQWMDQSVPSAITLLESSSNWLSSIETSALSKCNVLYDSTWVLNNQYATAQSYSEQLPVKAIYIKGKKMFPIEFDNTGDTIIKGCLYMFLISDSGATPHPTFSRYTRVTFAD